LGLHIFRNVNLSMFTLDTFVLVKCTLSEYLMGIEATAFAYFHFVLL